MIVTFRKDASIDERLFKTIPWETFAIYGSNAAAKETAESSFSPRLAV